MSTALAVACGAFGLAIGTVLPRVVSWAAQPDSVRCPRWLVVPLTGVLFAVVGWRVAPGALVPVLLYLVAVGVALAVIDVGVHRLPDRLTLPSYPIVAALLAVATLSAGDWHRMGRAGLGAVVLLGAYYLVALVAPGGMGFGDVKLAGVLGLVLGWIGWTPLLVGAFLGFGYGAVVSVALIAARRATRKTQLPFGPFMLTGALTVVCLGQPVSTLVG